MLEFLRFLCWKVQKNKLQAPYTQGDVCLWKMIHITILDSFGINNTEKMAFMYDVDL